MSATKENGKTHGYIQPLPDDSAEQQQRWANLAAERAKPVRDYVRIGQLSAAIRKEWQERSK